MGSLSSLGWFFNGGWLINKGRAGVYLSGFNGYPLVLTNGLPWKMMTHRIRWFTELKNGWIFHGYVKLSRG
jgi:hypothetical protein